MADSQRESESPLTASAEPLPAACEGRHAAASVSSRKFSAVSAEELLAEERAADEEIHGAAERTFCEKASLMRYAPRDLYIIYSIKLAESTAYFAFSYIYAPFLSDEFGLSDVEAGIVYALYGVLCSVFGLLAGPAIDALSLRCMFLPIGPATEHAVCSECSVHCSLCQCHLQQGHFCLQERPAGWHDTDHNRSFWIRDHHIKCVGDPLHPSTPSRRQYGGCCMAVAWLLHGSDMAVAWQLYVSGTPSCLLRRTST